MAAGRNGVLLRRESYKYGSIKEFDYYGNVVEADGSRNHHATPKNRCRSSLIIVDDSGSGRNGSYGGKEDREQGEFPAHASLFQAGHGEIFQEGDEALPPPQKRRKFSPIVWDQGEKEVRISSKNRIMQVAALSPTRPPLPSSPGDDGVLHGGVLRAKSPPDSSNVLPQEHSGNDNQDVVDEENNVKGWNITMSRWASDGHSPTDTSDNEYIHGKVCSSPEIGEFQRDNSEDRTTRSSGGSGGDCHYLSHSTDETDSENQLLIDSMDDVEEQSEAAFVSHSSSDSDENGGLTQVQRNINMLQSCRSVFEFEMIKKINEGTYGVVYKARDKKTGELVALKKVKMNLDREGFPLTSLREMNILLSCNHPSIVDVKEVVVDDFDGTFMVMEYMEYDLKGLMETKKQPFSIGETKSLMFQLLEGVKYLHDNWVLHRDLKTSNILLNKEGELKICDFGMSRQYGSPLKPYTPVVVTLWYRAPELLLGTKEYTTAIDMWSVGCIMAELLAKQPLFRGKTEVEQLDKIFRTLGTPDEKIWPGLSKLPGSKANFVKQPYNMLRKKFPATSFTGLPVLSELGFDLLTKLLTYSPEKRITVEDALLHDWFREAPLPKSDFKPIFPSWHC